MEYVVNLVTGAVIFLSGAVYATYLWNRKDRR